MSLDETHVTCCIPFYNDAIERKMEHTVKSIRKYVDEVWAFDGAWTTSANSRSEEREYVKSLDVDRLVDNQGYTCELDKRIAENILPPGWTFMLDTDEVLMNGGEWIKRATAFSAGSPLPLAYIVMLLDLKSGLTAHRRNLFRKITIKQYGVGALEKKIQMDQFHQEEQQPEHLPILIGHRELGFFHLSPAIDTDVMKMVYQKARVKRSGIPTYHRQNVWGSNMPPESKQFQVENRGKEA